MQGRSVRVCVLGTALAAAFLMLASPAPAAENVDIEKMISTAKTAADHQAIADYYKQQAKEAQAQADLHKKMAKDYSMSSVGRQATKTHFHEHCEALVRSYEAAAKEYDALAKSHEEMAKAAK